MNLKVLILTVFLFLNPVTALESSQSNIPLQYYIYSVDDLKTIEYNSNFTASFYLMNDIEITDEIWKPIGFPSRPFSGTFYGNNHTITFTKNTQLMPPVGYENGGCGLFGNIYSGRIYDLNIVLKGNLSSKADNAGSLAGVVNGNYSSSDSQSAFINCHVEGANYSVKGVNNVGGMIGYMVNGSIDNCSSDCSVLSEDKNAGGLIGSVFNGAVVNSSASGAVHSGGNAGGLIGTFRFGNISDSAASGSVTSTDSSGGFIGYISDKTVILNSTADGNVKPPGEFGNFIGRWKENCKPEVINCTYQGKEADLEPVPKTNLSKIHLAIAGVLVFAVIVAAVIYFRKENK